jgi:GH25 family lysozyme M1 (1,4-beta-N-acetylmuramidase)
MGNRFVLLFALAGCVDVETTSEVDQAITACADGPTVQGIDVSYYEASIDWNMVRANGIEFAIIRATDGTQYVDPKFPAYWAGAKAAGVIRGAYQFFRPAEDPIAQADLLLSKMGPPEPGDLPPVIDVEVSGGLTPAAVAASVRAWVDHVAQAIGRQPIIYAGLYSWHDLTGNTDITTSPLWVAQYTAAPCPNIPSPWTRWLMWQHSATGSVPGIPGSTLDINLFNGTRDDLLAFTNGGRCGDHVCSGGETTATCPQDCSPCGIIPPSGGEIDDGDACFLAGGPAPYLRRVASTGEGGDLIWTHATADLGQANFATWTLYFAAAGRYRLDAYTAHAYAQSRRAAYQIAAAGTTTTVTIDQSAVDGWQALGEFDFAAGGGQSVHLADNTGEASVNDVQLVFDAIRITPVEAPSPEPAPEPSPEPDRGDSDGDAHAGCSAGGSSSWLLALAALGVRSRRRDRANARR